METNDQNILFISMSDGPSGAENVLLMSALAVKGELLFLKKVKGKGLVVPSELEVKYLTNKSMFIGFFMLTNVLKQYKKGFIIMSTHSYLNAYLGFLKRIGYLSSQLIVRESTSVFTRFSGFKKLFYVMLYNIGYPAVDLIVCQSEIMRNQLLIQNKFIAERKVIVQGNPIDLKKIRGKAKKSLCKNDNEFDFICAAGRLIPEKGFSVLIRAFAHIHQRYPNLRLFLFGEGKERHLLIQLISNYNLEDHVILKGQSDNPIPYFKHAKMCVVSSIKEGFPNVLLEMMTVNQSIVSTLCAGGIESIPSILKVEVDNVNGLANAIEQALEKDIKYQNDEVEDFLLKRSPEVFTQSIFKALQDQKSKFKPMVFKPSNFTG